MNARDLSEIKRRLNPEHRNPSVIRGCYISSDGQVISSFEQAVGMMPQEELEKYMSIFKKTLSGTMGQNLLPIDFSQEQMDGGEQYALLSRLHTSQLKDEEAVTAFYQKMVGYVNALREAQAQSVDEAQAASNYLVLLMHDGYDVPFRDGNGDTDRERSNGLFSYCLCSVCPVKLTKPSLRYVAVENEFHSRDDDWVVTAPELGFMFPAYEERGSNISRAMFYTKDAADQHEIFVNQVFGSEVQMTAQEQKDTFQCLMQETLEEECSLSVVQNMHEVVTELIEQQKADKDADPLTLTGREVKKVLMDSGVSEAKADAFKEKYEESFGEHAAIPAVNVITPKQFKVDTPNVSIKVAPEYANLVETRFIDGKYYLCILVDGEVEVNGMKVR